MSRLISLSDYAQRHGKSPVTMRQKAQRGMLRTAVKIGKTWMVEEDEPCVDNRVKSGKYAKIPAAGMPENIKEETPAIKEMKILLFLDREEIFFNGDFDKNDMERAQGALLKEIEKRTFASENAPCNNLSGNLELIRKKM